MVKKTDVPIRIYTIWHPTTRWVTLLEHVKEFKFTSSSASSFPDPLVSSSILYSVWFELLFQTFMDATWCNTFEKPLFWMRRLIVFGLKDAKKLQNGKNGSKLLIIVIQQSYNHIWKDNRNSRNQTQNTRETAFSIISPHFLTFLLLSLKFNALTSETLG